MASNSNIHSPYIQGCFTATVGNPNHAADLLKFNAYMNVVDSFDKACEIIKKKKLVLGEPAVVPFKYVHDDGTITTELVFGIGSLDSNRPYIKCSISNDVLDDAVITRYDENGNPVKRKLKDVLDDFITKDEANKIIDDKVKETLSSDSLISEVSQSVVESKEFKEGLDERFRWKPISEVLKKYE